MFWRTQKRLTSNGNIPRIEGEISKNRKINFKKISINCSKKKIKLAFLSMSALVVAVSLIIVFGSSILDIFDSKEDSLAMWLSRNQFADISGIDRHSYLEEYKLPQVIFPSDNDISVSLPPVNDSENNNEKEENIYYYDLSKIPDGETPIIPMDLSLYEYGNSYINNDTGLHPDTEALLNKNIFSIKDIEELSVSLDTYNRKNGPTVLIVHTHGTESYVDNGAISIDDRGSSAVFSKDKTQNVVSLGSVISKELNNAGIYTLHCEIMHDETQYKDSYMRAEETIKSYLKKYPSIQLVIDIHRDSIVKNNGDYIKPLMLANEKKTAQVMCVVGSEWGGEECPSWEDNLSLALKIRKKLNDKYKNMCRPPYLKSSTYNQEVAPYSLLIEIGSSANSYDEALNAAQILGDELADILNQLK